MHYPWSISMKWNGIRRRRSQPNAAVWLVPSTDSCPHFQAIGRAQGQCHTRPINDRLDYHIHHQTIHTRREIGLLLLTYLCECETGRRTGWISHSLQFRTMPCKWENKCIIFRIGINTVSSLCTQQILHTNFLCLLVSSSLSNDIIKTLRK